MDLPSDWAVFALALSLVIRAGVGLLSLYKSPKEVSSDLAQEMRAGVIDAKNQVREVKEAVEEIRDDHHELSREVSEITGGMESLRKSLDGLRDQVTALTNVIGIFNANRPRRN